MAAIFHDGSQHPPPSDEDLASRLASAVSTFNLMARMLAERGLIVSARLDSVQQVGRPPYDMLSADVLKKVEPGI